VTQTIVAFVVGIGVGLAIMRGVRTLGTLLFVPFVMISWLAFFRFAYWIAHPFPAAASLGEALTKLLAGPATYERIDYLLLVGSLLAAVWTVTRLSFPPEDPFVVKKP